ncbi:hypothetical protein IAU60_003155 [Kwoniella sp. DSM 27419]
MPAPPHLTPEQIAKAAERKAAKLAKKAALADGSLPPSDEQKAEIERRRFLKRDWVGLADDSASGYRVKIVTWNLLAQTLVRRELFPGSDCLRWSDRKAMLLAELEQHSSADIVCLQECDRLNDFLPALPRHAHVKGSGPGKLHGLVILYNKSRFFPRATRLVHLDQEDLQPDAPEGKARRGGSRQTKNVGLIVALQDVEDENRGIVVATTHLFWHPKYAYERVRQCIILMRAIHLNTQPSEATYQLLVAPQQDLPVSMMNEIDQSRVIHDSVAKIVPAQGVEPAPSASGTGTNTPSKDEEDDEHEGEDKAEGQLPNTRQPGTADGILPAIEMIRLMREVLTEGATSAYGSNWNGDSFVGRGGHDGLDRAVAGESEPAYTCFTPLFKLTLDYLLLLPQPQPASPTARITSLLRTPTAEQLGEGLPRKGICASDHLAVGCEVAW